MGRKWLFTFHYASTISSSAENIPRLIQALYIPLCFYYIAKIEDKFSNLYTSFTFHYASTISALDYNYFRIHSFFTFHYASTISKSPLSAICKSLTLHSTMLLLYQRYARVFAGRLPPLHSTMLLLYQILPSYSHRPLTLYIPLCFYYIHRSR